LEQQQQGAALQQLPLHNSRTPSIFQRTAIQHLNLVWYNGGGRKYHRQYRFYFLCPAISSPEETVSALRAAAARTAAPAIQLSTPFFDSDLSSVSLLGLIFFPLTP
jgi:hypothetical protein